MKGNVYEVDVDEHEEILERVAAIDVAKASAKVKPAVQKSMKDIVTEQQAVAKDLAAFDKAELDKLSATKGKLLQDLAKMKATIAGIKAKVGG